MAIRTDLACEASGLTEVKRGVEQKTREISGFPVTEVNIISKEAAERLRKPVGRYITVGVDEVMHRGDEAFRLAADVIARELRALLSLGRNDSVLVVGLGNEAITADSIGPQTLKSTIVTRHLRGEAMFARFRSVAAVASGVTGTTGMESAELVRAAVGAVRPDAVIVVDALASLSPDRLCRTVQLSDTGIIPGSGVGNSRSALNRETLGVPVIAIGVPTVVEAETLAVDIINKCALRVDADAIHRASPDSIVTPREIDTQAKLLSRLIGYAINLALHDVLSYDDIAMFIE